MRGAGIILDDLIKTCPLVHRWHFSSIQHALHVREEDKESRKDDYQETDEAKNCPWIVLYGKGYEEKAEESAVQKLEQTRARNKRARLYNDLGYIRSGKNTQNTALARKDLETAIDLHYSNLPITLLNLSYLDIDKKDYDKCVERIEAALLLSLSPFETSAAYLRLRLPEYHLVYRVKWEQHPANVVEAAYINLAYALLKSKGYEEAHKALQESSELFPSSARLKHALARLYLFIKRADLAMPIYRELSELPSLPDKGIQSEIQRILPRHIGRRTRKKGHGRRRK